MSCVSLENFRKFKSFHCIKMTWGGESAIFGVLNRGQNGPIGCHKGHWNLQKNNCCHLWRKNKCNMWWMMAAYLIDAYMFYWCRSIFFNVFDVVVVEKIRVNFLFAINWMVFWNLLMWGVSNHGAYAAPFHTALMQHRFTWRFCSTLSHGAYTAPLSLINSLWFHHVFRDLWHKAEAVSSYAEWRQNQHAKGANTWFLQDLKGGRSLQKWWVNRWNLVIILCI